MTACVRPDCSGGVIEETGYCTTCLRKPRSAPPSAPSPGPATGLSTTYTRGSGTWISGDLLDLPVFDLPDPSTLVLKDAYFPEEKRFCGECGNPVGRGYGGQPGLLEGICTRCGTKFSFSLKLHEGDRVDGRYEVVGTLKRGGMGWVYLARAKRLNDIYVVLKGLINTADELAKQLAVKERMALIALDHPNIVRILDFVSHPDPASGEPIDYLVMEHVGGPALADLKAGPARQPATESLPVEHVVAYVLEVLAALHYLHGEGLLYCDMKPQNVIRTGNRIKVIDLGAVREVDDRDSPPVGTDGFRVSDEEIRQHGLTVRSDVYTVGKTLKVMFQTTDDALAYRAGQSDIAFGIRSLEQVIGRATDDYERRFASAAEMSEQLEGVLREILVLRRRKLRPKPSAVFADPGTLLDAGLGSVPPLDRWTGAGVDPDGDAVNRPPGALEVARGLPGPRVDPADPAADFLGAAEETDDPAKLPGLLGDFRRGEPDTAARSAELPLCEFRARLRMPDMDNAAACLDEAERRLGTGHWRVSWHRGLFELARGDVTAAEEHFTQVYRALPGERVPKLAMGLCAEMLGRPDDARPYYDAVWRGEKAQVSAAFGLARLHLGEGKRADAVAALDAVPAESRYHEAARTAAVRVLFGRIRRAGRDDWLLPDGDDFAEADRRLAKLRLDGDAVTRLVALAREAALDWSGTAPADGTVPAGLVFRARRTRPGSRWWLRRFQRRTADGTGTVRPTRRLVLGLLEDSYASLADQARTDEDHGVLVDLANSVRPMTWW